jgi:plasmid stabilization system protein ParE
MPRLVISARALADISRLHGFLSARDAIAAARGVQAIQSAFKSLEALPQIGRPVAENPDLRELVIEFGVSGYLAMYRYDALRDVIIILAVKHQKENDYR